MNARNNHASAAQLDALSDSKLDIVSGGKRRQVTREEWEAIIAQRQIEEGTASLHQGTAFKL